MGTTHGAEELGLCFHEHACHPGARGRHHTSTAVGLYLGYGHVWKIQTNKGRQKYSPMLVTLSHDELLTNEFLCVNYGTLQMRIAVSRE